MDSKVRKSVTAGLLLFILTIVPAGCGGDFNSPPPPPPAQLVSLAVTPVGQSIAPGTTQQFTVTGNYSNGITQVLTTSAAWTSSNTAIADISDTMGSKGLATATMATGQTTIIAMYSGLSGSTSLTLSPVASIAVTPANPSSIAPGTNLQFTATGILADSAMQTLTTWATWTTSDPLVSTISDSSGSKGLATATYPSLGGTNSATITTAYTGISGTATLTSSALSSITVTPASASIPKGMTQQFEAIGTLADGTNQTLTNLATWASSSLVIATVSNTPGSKGRATGVNMGIAAITSSFTGVPSYAATLTVTPPVLTSITVTPVNPSIALGTTKQFTAIGTFSDATTQNLTSSVSVTWNSSATGVATISNAAGSHGLATSVGVGTTTIKAVSGSISGSTTLTVIPELVSITVSPDFASVVKNGFQQYTATGGFNDSSTKNLTTSVVWHSSDTTIAIISNQIGSKGIATALFTSGSTTITATESGITSNSAKLTVQQN